MSADDVCEFTNLEALPEVSEQPPVSPKHYLYGVEEHEPELQLQLQRETQQEQSRAQTSSVGRS